MPYVPIMDISPILGIRIIEGTTRGGRGGPVKHVRRINLCFLRDYVFEHLDVVCFQRRMVRYHVFPAHPAKLHFVVTA